MDENPFKQEKRLFPVDFAFPLSRLYAFELEIPAGYKLDGIPASSVFALEDKSASFTFHAVEKDGKLVIVSKISINQAYFIPENYAAIKILFDKIVEKHAEIIVLKKEK